MVEKESFMLGVAQNHSNLFMSPRQRIPGLIEGQIYTYPSKRWRKKRRQYLMNFMQPRRKELDPESDLHTISTVENPAASNEDSKDSAGLKDEAAKVIVHIMCLVFVHRAFILNFK
jgi:zinc finger protein ubi-d4